MHQTTHLAGERSESGLDARGRRLLSTSSQWSKAGCWWMACMGHASWVMDWTGGPGGLGWCE